MLKSINFIFDEKEKRGYYYSDGEWKSLSMNSIDDESFSRYCSNVENRIKILEKNTEGLFYKKQYDLTAEEGNSDGDISSEDITYDYVQLMHKVFGEVKIKVPKKSSYYLTLSIGEKFNEGKIKVKDSEYSIQNDMTFFFENVDEIVFSVNIYIWLKSITIQEYKQISIPTKVSDLENDLKFVSNNVEGENLIIKVK